jgi:hypothetical protein
MFTNTRQRLRNLLLGRVVGAESPQFKVEFIALLANLASRRFHDKSGTKVFFQTGHDATTRLVIDFAQYRFIRKISLPRGITLQGPDRDAVSFSADAMHWHQVGEMEAHVTIYRNDVGASIEFTASVAARYFGFAIESPRRLMRDSVEFEQVLPPVKFGELGDMTVRGGHMACNYQSTHTFGLFSNCSTSLADVISLGRAHIAVTRIDFSRGMKQFKDDPTKDVYPVFFEAARSIEPTDLDLVDPPTLQFDAQVDNHRPYKDLPLKRLQGVAQNFFWPSQLVRETARDLIEQAGVDPETTLAVYVRGTDKSQEVALAPIEDYIAAIESLDKKTPTKRDILVQTDQEQVLEAMTSRFGERIRSFRSLPMTRGNVGIHDLDFANELKLSRERFSVELIAAVFIISQCAQVITTTSNVGLWISIYRGSAGALYQFSAEGKLVSPDD